MLNDTGVRSIIPQSVAGVSLRLLALYALLAAPRLYANGLALQVAVVSALLAVALVVLSATDLRALRLPDCITLSLIGFGLVTAWAFGLDSVTSRVISAVAGFLFLFLIAAVYRLLRRRDGLGLGDAKLFAAAGAWLGMDGLPSVLLWASSTALFSVALAVTFGHRVDGSSRIPLGPFLALGFWLVWLYGPFT